MKRFSLSLIAILLIQVVGLVDADSLTLSGLDLYNNPSVSFPNGDPTISGTSIIFGPADRGYEKQFVVPLYSAGELSGLSSVSFTVSANLTRLPCIGSSDIGDWDPYIMITDGNDMVGILIGDNNGGEAQGMHLYDSGDIGSNRTRTPLFTNAGFPAINQSLNISLTFTLTDDFTQIDVSFLDGIGTYIPFRELDMKSALSLTIVRDNDVGEQYQVNSVTIATSVPEPSTILLIGAGLAGLAFLRRKYNRQHHTGISSTYGR